MKKLLAVLVVLALSLAGVAYWITHSRRPGSAEDLFTLASVEYGRLAVTVGGSGVIQPREVLVIMPEIPGKVVEIGADFNQIVEEGQVLLRLDDRKARLDLDRASLVVKLASEDVERATALRDGAKEKVDRLSALDPSVGLKKDLDAARFELRAAEATLRAAGLKVDEAREVHKLAELALRLTIIRVPVVERDMSGTLEKVDVHATPRAEKRKYLVMDRKVVLNRNVSPTETAPLFTLVSDLSQMQLQGQIAEGDISKVREGMPVDFTVSAYADGDEHFSGKLSEIRMMPASELGAVFYRVVIDVQNKKDGNRWMLRPGMTASVDIIRRKHDNTWKVPTAAISFQLDEQYQTEAAKAKLARWEKIEDRVLWKAVWIFDPQKKQPWPLFVRTGKKAEVDDPIRDAMFTEVLEWDPELKPDRADVPRVIIGITAASKSSFLGNMPNIKF